MAKSTTSVDVLFDSNVGQILHLDSCKSYVVNSETQSYILPYNIPLPEFMFASAFSEAKISSYEANTGEGFFSALEMIEAETVTSLQVSLSDVGLAPANGGLHRPVLDIDFPAALIPSSTEGHFHLYLDKPMAWDTYKKLLEALAEAGIIEEGYKNASIERRFTAVRLPWVKKKTTTTNH